MRGSECLDALALTVSLKLAPQVTLATAAAGMLSVDGRCKTLDARANGHSRSEGVGAVMLQPLRAHMSLRGNTVLCVRTAAQRVSLHLMARRSAS